MSHHWVRPPGGGLCCINCGSKRVCACAIDLNVWTYNHAAGCPLHLSSMPVCQPAIPQPVERPYEKTLDESERQGD